MLKTSQQSSIKHLLRCPSTLACQDAQKHGTSTTINTSSSSIESVQDECRKMAFKWLLEFDRKVTKDTNFLSIWYLETALKKGLSLKENNWQIIAASIMLLASKMNEIYPPSINSIIKRCKTQNISMTRETVIAMEGKIINFLDFQVAIQSPYNLIVQKLGENSKDIQQCEKLLKIILFNRQIHQESCETVSNAILYLISRNVVDSDLKGQYRTEIKGVAQKMYNYYKIMRKNYEEEKNRQKLKAKKFEEKTHSTQSTHQSQNSSKENQTQLTYPPKQNTLQRSQNIGNGKGVLLNRVNSYKFIPKHNNFFKNGCQKQNYRAKFNTKENLKESFGVSYFNA